MASFTVDDLFYNDYQYTTYTENDPRLTGKPDTTLLNKVEAHEMASFINQYMTKQGWTYKAIFQGIERILRSSRMGTESHQYWGHYLDNDLVC